MKNTLSKFKINNYTYLFILLCAMCGYIKNITIIFFICLIHELGHIFLVKLYKYNIVSVELFPFGGYTLIDKKINTNINKDLLIAVGGILFQIILFLVVFIFKEEFNYITYDLIVNYNLFIIIFNLLPIIPLDGNNIIHLMLEKYFSYHMSYRLNSIISFLCLIVFVIINIFYKLDNYCIIFFLFYQLIIYLKNYKYIFKRFLLERYLYDLEYDKINNNTKSIKELKKNVLHYFKDGNKYIKEKDKINSYMHLK